MVKAISLQPFRLLLQWFTENYMQANASKFQYILCRSGDKLPDNNVLHIQDGVDLKPESCWCGCKSVAII